MNAFGQGVLEIPAQELLRGKSNALMKTVSTIAISEGDVCAVAVEQSSVGERGTMNVATEIVDDVFSPFQDGLDVHDPMLASAHIGELRLRKSAAGERHEYSPKLGSEGADGDEKRLSGLSVSSTRNPSTVGRQSATGYEEMDMRVPLQGSRPGMQNRQCTELASEVFRVCAEGLK